MVNNRKISYAGKVVKEYRNGDKCIIEVGRFIATDSGECKKVINLKVLVVGRVEMRLTTLLKGKMDLVSATIDKVSENDKGVLFLERFKNSLQRFADYCSNLYRQYLPSRESALLSGIVFGQKEDIGYDFYEQMVRSGSIHIAVASGFNLMLLGGFVMQVFFYLWSRKTASVVAIISLFFYALITGFEPPMIRAWLMISFLFVGQAFGRKQHGWWALVVSVWLVLVWDMGMLWNISFQLSVAASIGLIVLVPYVVSFFSEMGFEAEVKFVEKTGFLGTFMATVLTTPIIWYYFGRVSFIGLFSNLLILPLVPPIMVLGLLMLVLPSLLYLPAYALLHTLVLLIEFFGS